MKFLNRKDDDYEEENPTEVLRDLVRGKEEPNKKDVSEEKVTQESRSEKLPLDTYLKASYPLIWIRTEEDQRAVKLIKESIQKVNSLNSKVVYAEFRSTTGMVVTNSGELEFTKASKSVVEGTNPVGALKYITENVKDEDKDPPIVLVLHNINHALRIPQFTQSLKDTAIYSRLYGCHIFLVGAALDIPAELRSLVTVYDLDLPNQTLFRSNFTAIVNEYSSLLEEEATPDKINVLAASAVGMTEMQGENALALTIVSEKKLDPKVIQYEKEQAIKRSEVLEFVHTKETIDQLGGWQHYKDWLSLRRHAMTPEAIEYGLKFPKGVIVVGIPGCGKSLAARATSSYLGIPLLKFDMGKLFRSLVGQSEQTTRAMAKTAEAVAPIVLWIEEIEKSAAGGQSSGSSDSGTTARVIATLLTWMQETTKPIFFFATCNNIDTLPAEVYRKGRFSELFGVQEPDEEERSEIWRIKIGGKRPDRIDDFNYDQLIEVSESYTGAEIEIAVEDAMYTAFSDDKREFTTDDLVSAVQRMIPQSVTSAKRCDAIRDWMRSRVRMVSGKDVSSVEEKQRNQTWRKIRGEE